MIKMSRHCSEMMRKVGRENTKIRIDDTYNNRSNSMNATDVNANATMRNITAFSLEVLICK